MSNNTQTQFSTNKLLNKQLKAKAFEFLNSKKCANNLLDIIQCLRESISKNLSVTSCLLALENIFTELLKRKEMSINIEPLKPKEDTPENQYKEWLLKNYKDSLNLMLSCLDHEKTTESTQALISSMKLLAYEGKYPIEKQQEKHYFPVTTLRLILAKLLSSNRNNTHLFARYSEYSGYIDVLFYTWKILPGLTPKGNLQNKITVQNFLEFISVIPVTKDIQTNEASLCSENDFKFDYQTVRKNINKSWNCVMVWNHDETTHRQLLILLLEKILVHLDKPILLTDFLMDSLDVGGAISLLALQGIFILIQQHNLTYPNIYEKLYSMFEPEIFHTKYKARLFYLADIFLSSSHLPERLVAAFVKRLARLALIAPPQDIVIILYFVGNLILRHPGLKRLICHPTGGEVAHDPFMMDERDPTKSNAIDSSLWEVAALQLHTIPSVSTAAKFISNPLPTIEWDLSQVLEIKEDDIFDQEITKKTKEYALSFERPMLMNLVKGEKTSQYFNFF